jgi:copper chaperone CopZ
MSETVTYSVPGMSSGHCRAAIVAEVGAVPGVGSVEVDLDTKLVRITGECLDNAALREAIHEAGYEATGGEEEDGRATPLVPPA